MNQKIVSLVAVLAFSISLHATPLSGTKSVGPTGNYPSLTAAIADIQAQSLGGALILELQSTYFGTVEVFPLTVPSLNGANAFNTVTIRPATGAAGLSLTSANGTATVNLIGAQFVTFDGRPGGVGAAKQFTIANTSPGGAAVRFINEASGNALRFLTLRSVNANPASGTVVFSTTTGANGNDNNTIDTCDLRDGATTPANAIYSLGSTGTTAQNNSGNTVTNCNVFNFYSTTTEAAGIRIQNGGTDWTISGNSFYQTASRAAGPGNVRGIYVNNTLGNHFVITGNFIGGTAPNAGGTAWTTTGTTALNQFQGIFLSVGTATPSSVQGNTIQNFIWTSSSTLNTLPGIWSGIYVQAGNVNLGTVTGNTIGSGTGTGSISVTNSSNGGITCGIGSVSSGAVAIVNNTIGAITTSGTSATIAASLFGIQVTAGVNTISNNLVGSTTTANSLNAATSSTATTPQQVIGIFSFSSTSAKITSNTVANLNNNYNSFTVPGQILGIVTSAGVNTITGNTVRNLSTTSQTSGTATSASVLGISQSSSLAGQTVSQNVVHSLANTAASGSVQVIGIYYTSSTGPGANLIARNLVHSLSIASSATGSAMFGMSFNSGTFTAQNNMVRVGFAAIGFSTAGASVIIGIYDASTTPSRNFYHNSVYVGGTQTAGGNNTFAFYSPGASNPRNFRNNIFVNARSNSGGAGKHYAVLYGGGIANPAGLTANNNLFFVSGSGGVLGSYSGDRTTLAAWQAATGQDASSAVTDPLFINPTGTAATVDLHLQASNPAEGGGVLIATVTDDFDGQTRSSLTPVDIGADAGNFTSSSGDIYAPAISYPQLANGSTPNRTLTGWASIVDNSGIIASGPNAPRLYYKNSSDADVFNVANDSTGNGWKYVTGTDAGGGSYSFTIDYTLINGGSVSVGNVIQYFVVAQDAANNLGSSPVTANAAASPPVQNISGKPAVGVNSYSIVAALGGTVTVGPGGTYPTLTAAGGLFAALNASVLTGNLTVNIIGDITIEDGSTALTALNATNINSYPPTDNTFTVTIQPDSATMRTISGSAANYLIALNDANRVTMDGSFGGSGRHLTFRNTNIGNSAATITFINDASNNTVRNCVLEGAPDGTVVLFNTGATTGNDNNTITGNQIRDRSDTIAVPAYLVLSQNTSDTVPNRNNTIANNELFNFTAYGVLVNSGSASWSITGNTIYQTGARTTPLYGIYFSGLGTNLIRGNTVRDLTTSSTAYGIFLPTQTGNTTLAGNRIWNLGNTAASTSFAAGIFVQPSAGQSLTVVNNMVALNSSGITAQNLYGIFDGAATGSTTITAHNTVLLTGNGGTGADTWAFVSPGNSTATVKNNIFLNLRTGGGNHFAANRLPASTGALAMDYNVYAGTGLTSATDFFDASDGNSTIGTPISYAQWQANVPTDTHSSAGNPGGNYSSAMFVDAANGNLHLVPGGNVLVNNTGTPLAGVTNDFDGDFRSDATPDVGADEIGIPNHRPVAASPFTLGVKLGVPATVKIIGGKHSPTDADGDALTITGVSGAANGVTSTDGTNVTYTATSGSTDSFVCAISDGHGGTANQTVNVAIDSGGLGYNQLSAQSLGGGTNVLTFLGTPNFNYALELSTNLVDWLPQVTNAAATNTWLYFTNVTTQSPVFYRTRYVP